MLIKSMHGIPDGAVSYHCKVQIIISYDQAMMKFTLLDERAYLVFFQTLCCIPTVPCLLHDESAINLWKRLASWFWLRLFKPWFSEAFQCIFVCIWKGLSNKRPKQKWEKIKVFQMMFQNSVASLSCLMWAQWPNGSVLGS